jgi:hypothetical protein
MVGQVGVRRHGIPAFVGHGAVLLQL